jgi:hypothetical protein
MSFLPLIILLFVVFFVLMFVLRYVLTSNIRKATTHLDQLSRDHAVKESEIEQRVKQSKEEALKRGFTWREEEKKSYETTLQSDSIPLTIKEVSDDIIKEIIECAHKGECSDRCTTAFRITADEFTLYKKLGIPLPALCFNCRHAARIAYRNPRTLWRRSCMCTEENHIHREKCQNEFETSYAPERKEQVYCETCYQQEIQ